MAAARRQHEIDRITKNCQKDGGDRELALKILNLHHKQGQSVPIMIGQAAFIAKVNRQIRRIDPSRFPPGVATRQRAIRAAKRVFSAARTVAGIQSWNPPWDFNFQITINAGHIPLGTTWAGQLPPVARGASFNAYRAANIPPNIPRSNNDEWDPAPADAPTMKDRNGAIASQIADWQARAVHAAPIAHAINPTMAIIRQKEVPGNGDCYFASIAESLYGDWSRYPEVKANIKHFFMGVLAAGSGHPRYRTYCWLQHSSYATTLTYGVNGISIARCLHTHGLNNGRQSDRPWLGWGLNQIVADYYNVEVVEFSDPAHWQPADPLYAGVPVGTQLRHKARGSRNRKQIFLWRELKTLPTSGHKDVVIWPGFLDLASDFRWDTSGDTILSRMDPMPWTAGLAVVPNNLVPRPLPANLRHENPANRATVLEEAYVAAGRPEFPYVDPVLPAVAVMLAWPNAG